MRAAHGVDPSVQPAAFAAPCAPCRAAGEMLLDEMFEAFEAEAAGPFAAAVGARLAEAAAARAAGREDWWKLREAALYAVGTVSDQLIELSGARLSVCVYAGREWRVGVLCVGCSAVGVAGVAISALRGGRGPGDGGCALVEAGESACGAHSQSL